jgi:hypothetical protein
MKQKRVKKERTSPPDLRTSSVTASRLSFERARRATDPFLANAEARAAPVPGPAPRRMVRVLAEAMASSDDGKDGGVTSRRSREMRRRRNTSNSAARLALALLGPVDMPALLLRLLVVALACASVALAARDYFAVLAVSKSSTEKEIKRSCACTSILSIALELAHPTLRTQIECVRRNLHVLKPER